MSRKLLLFFLLPLIVLSPTHAGSLPLKIVGFDDMSCKAWAQSKSDPDVRQRYIAWLRGFLSGHNYANQSAQVSVISSGTVELFVDRYCNEKPQGQFSDAALRLSDQFSGRNSPITK